MTEPRLFEIFFGEETFFCAAWPSHLERDRALSGTHPDTPPPLPASPADREPRPRGRPSFDPVIAEAVKQIDPVKLDPSRALATRARDILRRLAATSAELPSQRCVETYLAEHAREQRNNSRKKSRRKSPRAILRPTEAINVPQTDDPAERPQRRARGGR